MEIENVFDADPGYKPELVIQDDEDLSSHERFKKYIIKRFPLKIARELIAFYPNFEIDNYHKLKKLINQSAFFYGKPGTGKTFYACALVLLSKKKSWFYLDHNTRFFRVADLFIELRRLIKNNDRDPDNGLWQFDSLVKKVSHCKWLILDDLGIEKNTDFTLEILDQIIDTRYQENRKTIVTTNYDIEQITRKKEYSRIMSRLMDMVHGRPIHLLKTYRKVEIKINKFY